MKTISIFYEADATRYDMLVSRVDNKDSDYDSQYCVSLINFGECFFDTDLSFIAEAIVKSSKVLSPVDAVNIQNAIAKQVYGVEFVEFDYNSRRIVLG